MKLVVIVAFFFLMPVIYLPFHELGHLLIANHYGVPVRDVNWMKCVTVDYSKLADLCSTLQEFQSIVIPHEHSQKRYEANSNLIFGVFVAIYTTVSVKYINN